MNSRVIYFPIIYRYILREIWSPFWLALFVFTGVLFLVRSLRLVDLVINKNVPALDIFLLFSYIIPSFLELAIPMSLLIGIMLAFGRLSADSEIVAIRTTGTSIGQLISPVLLFSFLACLITLGTALYVRPWANYRLGLGLFEIAKLKASAGLIPGIFNDFGLLTIYASSVDSNTGRLEDVIIADRRDPKNPRSFLAKHGALVADNATRTIALKLYDGSIHEGRGLNFHLTDFEINNINLNQEELLSGGPAKGGKKAKEMYIGELAAHRHQMRNVYGPVEKKHYRNLARYNVEFHRRFALPVSCLCIGLIAMALGIQPSRGGHHWGASANIIVGIGCIFSYYMLIAIGQGLSKNGDIPAWIGLWSPNFIFGIIALTIIRQVGSERWLAVSEAVADGFRWIANKTSTTQTTKE